MNPADALTSCSDEELLAGLRRGQREAFGTLVRRYEAELYGYLRRYLGDRELAEDVFQNTFLQVFTKVGKYEPGRPVRLWLYAIATNQAIDAMRRVGRRHALSLDREERDDESPSGTNVLESPHPGPVELAQGEERRALVREGVDRLPEFLRQVVILAYYQGLKCKDVADILGIPVGTVKSRLHTALARLHEMWAAVPALKE